MLERIKKIFYRSMSNKEITYDQAKKMLTQNQNVILNLEIL